MLKQIFVPSDPANKEDQVHQYSHILAAARVLPEWGKPVSGQFNGRTYTLDPGHVYLMPQDIAQHLLRTCFAREDPDDASSQAYSIVEMNSAEVAEEWAVGPLVATRLNGETVSDGKERKPMVPGAPTGDDVGPDARPKPPRRVVVAPEKK